MILTPYLDDYDVIVYQGDCIDVMRQLPKASVDAVVTDPPYGIGFMGKEWDVMRGDPRSWAEMGGPIGERHTGGSGSSEPGGAMKAGLYDLTPVGMNRFQTWTEAWAREAYRVLKPGGHLLAFASTRTYHRMASGVEDAGFEIRDCIAWMYGSGFPKSLDVSKAIDKLDARDEQQERRYRFTAWVRSTGLTAKQIDKATGTNMGGHYTTDASQPAIMTREHLEAIRDLVDHIPAWVEAECDKRTVESRNMAAREVIGERIVPIGPGFAGETYQGENTGNKEYADTLPATPEATKWAGWGTALKPAYEPIVVARKPLTGTVAQNVLQHGTGALNIDATRIGTEERVAAYTSLAPASGNKLGAPGTAEARRGTQSDPQTYVGRWPANVALDDTAAEMLDEQSGERPGATSFSRPDDYAASSYKAPGGTPLQAGYADSGGASRFFYTAKASRQDRNVGGLANNTHPTVKPTDLMRWLIRLVTPPGGLIIDPFGGSGTTGLAARTENVRCILIEREEEYLAIIRDRLAQLSLFSVPEDDAA